MSEANRTIISADDAAEYRALGERDAVSWVRRVLLAIKMGVPESLGMTRREYADSIGCAIRSAVDRRPAVAALLDEGLSKRAVGDILGISDSTVRPTLREIARLPPGIAREIAHRGSIARSERSSTLC
jgi:DNA-binding NarL/FixJ family response regulator